MRLPQRILVIGPSNVGDAVLMSPVIERLRAGYPDARLTLLVGERARRLFADDPRVHALLCMDEFGGMAGSLRLAWAVWRLSPDVLVDLRHTVLPLLWRPWRILSYVWPVPRRIVHMRDRHLWRLATQCGMWNVECGMEPAQSKIQNPKSKISQGANWCPVWIAPEDTSHVARLLSRWNLDASRALIVICPGARSHIKRWSAGGFARIADRLIEDAGASVVFSGEPDEIPIIQEILQAMRHQAHNAAGSTTVQQLAALVRQANLVITNDSASLHLACAVEVPVLALFGPTDPRKYGPTGPYDRVIQRRLFCVPCERSLCRFSHECMRFITADEVYSAARQLLQQTAHSKQQTEKML